MTLVVVERYLDVLDDGLGTEGGTGDGIYLHLLGILDLLAVPLILQRLLHLRVVLGGLGRLEELDLLHFIVLDIHLQRGGAGIALNVLAQLSGVDDVSTVLLGHRLVGHEAHQEKRKA